MKKLFISLLLAIGALFVDSTEVKAQSAEGYFAALDTSTNADTTTYELSVTGAKHAVAFQTNVTKITGTVGGTINIYGSVDGTNYVTTAIATQITIGNASTNYAFTFGDNRYKKYKIVIINAAGGTMSHRTYYLYRKT